ncbi:unnamed protein product [Diatraea saccharalis]|uniref:MOSC domain-containing protein n=1 Tax=Diatraea saccharalis TaxID=40085 RepID=A0A9P0G342_9NEOP|nr:unnamed protein product [Diatraea saccharalis]
MSYKVPVHGTAVIVTAVGGVLGIVYCLYRFYQETRKKKLPQKWRSVGFLKSLNIYPIKSCGVISTDKAECTLLGLKREWLRDRILCVVDDSYNFITARVYQDLLLVSPNVDGSVITLEHPAMDVPVKVDLAEVIATEFPKTATIWGNEVSVYDCGNEASQWFTKLLKRPSKNYYLVLYASQKCRFSKDPRYKYFNFTKDDTGAFPDDTSYHLINEASVEDLNPRLEGSAVTARQFRPNFIISGCQPYDEDNWNFIKIGENVFEVVMPCLRCVLTTLDPETGSRNSNNEPLQTLRGYRQHDNELIRKAFGNSPRMGLQLALRSESGGVISVNDPVSVA